MSNVLRSPLRITPRSPIRLPLSRGGTPAFLKDAIGHFTEQGLTGEANVSSWVNDSGTGGTPYDLNVIVGDPLSLKPHPSGSVLLYGENGDYLSTPAANMTTFNQAIVYDLALSDWTPAGFNMIFAQYAGSGGDDSINFGVFGVTGLLRFGWTTDGSSLLTASSTEAPSVTDGQPISLRVDVTATTCIFYTSTDSGANWTQLGDTIAITLGTIHNSSRIIEIGASNTGTANRLTGNIGTVELYNNSVLAISMNPADHFPDDALSFSSSATGEVWTLNNDAFIQNTGRKVMHSIGQGSLETTAGQDTAQIAVAYVVARQAGTPTGSEFLFDARSLTTNRLVIFSDNAQANRWTVFRTGGATLAEAFDNLAHVFAARLDTETDMGVSDVGSVAANIGTNSWDFGTLGSRHDGANAIKGWIGEAILFDTDLTPDQVAELVEYLKLRFSI